LKKLIIIVCFFIYCGASAQQRPQYTQYIFNNYLLNPALSGIENYIDLKFGYRKQWAGIDNAPQTSFVTANWSLGDDYLWRNPLSLPDKGDDPMSKSYMQNYTASPAHHGVGITAVADRTGPISRVDVNLTYAYHLQLGDRLNLSTGIAAGISRINLDIDKLTLEDANDPALKNTIISQTKPDISIGVWLYGASFFAGASMQQVIPQNLKFTTDPNYDQGKESAHIFLTGGYRFFLEEDIAAIPSVMIKYVSHTPASFDFNFKMAYKDRIWLGGSYRKNDSFSAMAGVNINKLVNLTYSYDFTTSQLNKVSNGSHEIVLGIQLNKLYRLGSGMPIW
jgi:type IX secretion system PorP/SprF family membrane protein